MESLHKIALGGGCHWCTEAVFQSLKGVDKVEQGFVASEKESSSFSEAVIVHFDSSKISLRDIIAIHLHTHKSTSEHSMRSKYRSAIYVFSEKDELLTVKILSDLQEDFERNLITQVLTFKAFKLSDEMFHNYYYSNKQKPFCETYINPKLKLLLNCFSELVDSKKLV
ncbi:peptide-methionine (S)-S-oxide reductase [Maribacter sp. 2308TA10-17]|uniref:peptide-methionine (S)-S-oxide reductase n=1 Tax=Maribacter sp. 2308TA10-17 TaxID=3386276 RepID=UPI0039BCC67C